MPDPVIHHIECCVQDAEDTMERLKSFGFRLFAKRENSVFKSLCVRLGAVYFLLNERKDSDKVHADPGDLPVNFCCKSKEHHMVDTVFNIAFSVPNVKSITDRVSSSGGLVIQEPTKVSDDKGEITFAIVKSICGNVIHSLLQTDMYNGAFLCGYETTPEKLEESPDFDISHIDHFTFACFPGESNNVIAFYEKCFGMNQFSINKQDTEDMGLIVSDDGVGIRLKAMEFSNSETGLTFDAPRSPNSVMLVVVETLAGQTNCNIDSFLKNHRGPGVEHVAFFSRNIVRTVTNLTSNGVKFRMPPFQYYNEIEKNFFIHDLGQDLTSLKRLGILLDNETTSDSSEKKYIMQIFAEALFKPKKTFFIEIIHRVNKASGLGTGNIIALVRSIRQEERRKAESKKQEMEEVSCPRQLY